VPQRSNRKRITLYNILLRKGKEKQEMNFFKKDKDDSSDSRFSNFDSAPKPVGKSASDKLKEDVVAAVESIKPGQRLTFPFAGNTGDEQEAIAAVYTRRLELGFDLSTDYDRNEIIVVSTKKVAPAPAPAPAPKPEPKIEAEVELVDVEPVEEEDESTDL
jgi:hypothetical protein